jgi:hypothetical protein
MRKFGPKFAVSKSWATRLMFALGALLVLGQSTARAGTIVPWASEANSHHNGMSSGNCAGLEDAMLDDSANSSASTGSGRTHEPVEQPRSPRPEKEVFPGLLDSSGGASTPETAGSSQNNLAPAVLGGSLVCDSPVHYYRRLRESALRLPQPPCDELMDPPKTRP